MENKVKSRRKEQNVSQTKLATKTSIGRSTISDIENGKHTPSVDVALKIAQVLECYVEDIFIIDSSLEKEG